LKSIGGSFAGGALLRAYADPWKIREPGEARCASKRRQSGARDIAFDEASGNHRAIGNRAREKGLPEGRYKFFVVVAWFGGEIIGAVAAEIASQFLLDDQNGNDLLLTYLFAIFTASLFVWFVFKLVAIRPDIQQDDDSGDFEDEEPPRIQCAKPSC